MKLLILTVSHTKHLFKRIPLIYVADSPLDILLFYPEYVYPEVYLGKLLFLKGSAKRDGFCYILVTKCIS